MGTIAITWRLSSVNFSHFKLLIYVLRWRPSWISHPHKKHNLVKDIPMIIHLQLGFSQFISFREEDLWNFSQSEHIIGPGVFYSDIKWKMAATTGLSLTLDPMGKVSQNASSLKPLGQLKPNYPGIIIWRSSKKFVQWTSMYSQASIRFALWNIFPIGSNVKLSPAVATILDFISEQFSFLCWLEIQASHHLNS
jgi:hypothetical protein